MDAAFRRAWVLLFPRLRCKFPVIVVGIVDPLVYFFVFTISLLCAICYHSAALARDLIEMDVMMLIILLLL